MTNYKGTIEQHIGELELAIINAEDETHKAYWQREKEFLEELKWYKEQDLIKSEDAIETLSQMQWYDADGHSVEDYTDKKEYAETWAAQIPKAEPPKSVEWWNRSPNHDKFDYNESLKTESMASAERLIKDVGGSQ